MAIEAIVMIIYAFISQFSFLIHIIPFINRLCVRRLSLVDKHQTSKNDAMNEGMFFQKPEVMNVMINAVSE